MVPITSIFSGIENMFDQGTRQAKVAIVSQVQIEGKPRDLPKQETNSESQDRHRAQQKKPTDFFKMAEFLSNILIVAVIGLVSISRVALHKYQERPLTSKGCLGISCLTTVYHGYLQLHKSCRLARKRLFPCLRTGLSIMRKISVASICRIATKRFDHPASCLYVSLWTWECLPSCR